MTPSTDYEPTLNDSGPGAPGLTALAKWHDFGIQNDCRRVPEREASEPENEYIVSGRFAVCAHDGIKESSTPTATNVNNEAVCLGVPGALLHYAEQEPCRTATAKPLKKSLAISSTAASTNDITEAYKQQRVVESLQEDIPEILRLLQCLQCWGPPSSQESLSFTCQLDPTVSNRSSHELMMCKSRSSHIDDNDDGDCDDVGGGAVGTEERRKCARDDARDGSNRKRGGDATVHQWANTGVAAPGVGSCGVINGAAHVSACQRESSRGWGAQGESAITEVRQDRCFGEIVLYGDATRRPAAGQGAGEKGFSPPVTGTPRDASDRVSWFRRKDYQLLTVGLSTYSSDDRFLVEHTRHLGNWALRIKNARKDDEGLYECQISTHPPQSIFIELRIVEAVAEILEAPDLHIDEGSTLRLECKLKRATESPLYVFWPDQ
ncbi:hypothetical protein AND_005750 [Anopheles darlingi]|uniref:Ig-like domain-containing protein n=1 Tax=Anopheles darlingi TaxID=43151 RepID=W5JID9_ANODA|nr:hypothetical protein AND_005750 [Anopheles darlingi]